VDFAVQYGGQLHFSSYLILAKLANEAEFLHDVPAELNTSTLIDDLGSIAVPF
jgi:hypothetical protein